MKKFFGLLQNELIKIWKQTGYRVLLFILIGISLITPLFNLLGTINFDMTAKEEYDDYISTAENEEGIYREYFTALAESRLFFIDNGLDDTWKYSYFCRPYEELYMRFYAAKLIESGDLDPNGDDKYSPFENYFYVYEYVPEAIDPQEKYEIPTYEKAKAELDAKGDEILSATEQDISRTELEASKAMLEYYKQNANDARQNHEANPHDAQLKYELDIAEISLTAQEKKLEAWQAIYDNSATPKGWAYSMNWKLSSALNSMIDCVPMPEELYEDEDYDTYLASCKKNYDYYSEAASVYLHSIKTDNCLSPLSNDSMLAGLLSGGNSLGISTKTQLRSAVTSFISLLTVLMVVLASSMISSEFSSGTIRLLVIRPCSRRQIIASKLAAVGLIYVVLVAVMTVVFTIESVLVFGVGDLFAPDIVYFAGNIIDLPFFVLTFERIAVASLAALAYVCIATVLASLTRKNALAIVMSMLIYVFGATASSLILVLAQLFPNALGWVVYTPLAYMSLTTILPPAQELLAMTGLISDAMLWLGVLYHIIFIAGMVYLTVLAFRKKQIKN